MSGMSGEMARLITALLVLLVGAYAVVGVLGVALRLEASRPEQLAGGFNRAAVAPSR